MIDDGEKKIYCLFDEQLPVEKLLTLRNPKNRNKHSQYQIERLAKIMRHPGIGIRHPITISNRSGTIPKGHGRLEAAVLNKYKTYPVVYEDYATYEDEYADSQADNGLALMAELDLAGINQDLADLDPSFDLELLGIKDFVLEPADKYVQGGSENPTMADKFMIPPFTILNAREGWWQDRKRQWISLGIKSEIGRGGGATSSEFQKPGTIGAIPPNQKDIKGRKGKYA